MNLKPDELKIVMKWFDIAEESLDDDDLKLYDKIKEFLDDRDPEDDEVEENSEDEELSFYGAKEVYEADYDDSYDDDEDY
jgi:hypothetical protein